LSNETLNSGRVGSRQSRWPWASSPSAYFMALFHLMVKGASSGVVYIGLPVSVDLPA
jgi:hypothetical protein